MKAAQSKGKVYITNLSNLKLIDKDNNYFFMITRGSRNIEGVKQLKELAPSPFLFNKYIKEWKGLNNKDWWSIYKEIYLSELNYEIINRLKCGLNDGKNITLICFCGDESICHRSIIKEIFSTSGYETISIKKEG